MKVLFVGGSYSGKLVEVSRIVPEVRMQKMAHYKPGELVEVSQAMEAKYVIESYSLERFIDKDGTEHIMYMNGDVARPMNLLLQEFISMAGELHHG